jgi:photosystem II stability/assembly factor-like uncharacterized protein
MFLWWSAAPAAAPEDAWIKPKADQSILLDIARNGSRWIVVGERGHVLASDDAEKWRQMAVPTRVTLTAVDIDDSGLGIVVGHDATVIRSRDFGETWDRVYEAPEEETPLLDVVIVDEDRIVAVGAYGLYLESSDGGDTWEQRVLEPRELDQSSTPGERIEEEFFYDFHLNDIEVADSGRWYIAAEAGTVYRSDNGGETWLRLPSPYAGSFFGVMPMSGDNLFLFGLQGRLYHSSDAGVRWRRIDTGTDATLSGGVRLDDDKALVVGYAGTVLKNVDGEGNLERIGLANRPALSDARLLANGNLLSVGQSGVRQWTVEALSGP